MENNKSLSSVEETARYIHLMQGLPELTDELKSKIQEYIGKIPDMLAAYKSDGDTREMLDAAMKQNASRDIDNKDSLLIASLLSPSSRVESDSKERFLPALAALGIGTIAEAGTVMTALGLGAAAGWHVVSSLWKK